MKRKSKLRASLTAEASAAVNKLTVLSVIQGISFEDILTQAITQFVNAKPNAKHLTRGTWLSTTELIARLESDFDIKTNFQTLSNYRRAGIFDGFYCSDGKGRIFFLLESVAEVMAKPRPPLKPEKQTVA